MNQLETNLTLWAICSLILFELLFIICLCRCCFNRVKPKRFYVKREEYEYLEGAGGVSSKFQTILRPPHADELALVGTIREQKSNTFHDNGIRNLGFYRDSTDDDTNVLSSTSLVQSASPFSSQHANWIELRQPVVNNIINTSQLPSGDYLYTHQPAPIRPTIIDFRSYHNDYHDHVDDDNGTDDNDIDGDDLENFHFQSLRRPEIHLSHALQRTDTSTESYAGNYSTSMPKSILKSSTSVTPPVDTLPTPYSRIPRSRTSSKFDESSRISVKINTDESIPTVYSTSAIEKTIPNESIHSPDVSISLSSMNPMRFASVSKLNDIEWEVPREFQTLAHDAVENKQPIRNIHIYSSDENLNNNTNRYKVTNDGKLSYRKRSQSAAVDERTNVSRIFVPWDNEKKIGQSPYLLNNSEQGNVTQQQAFEY